jgi:SAM-dependent methyltransferase
MPSAGQEGHWDKTYSENPAFFRDGSSEFTHMAINLFKDAAVQSVLELGCGQWQDTLLFAKEGFQVTALAMTVGSMKIRLLFDDLAQPGKEGVSESSSGCLVDGNPDEEPYISVMHMDKALSYIHHAINDLLQEKQGKLHSPADYEMHYDVVLLFKEDL